MTSDSQCKIRVFAVILSLVVSAAVFFSGCDEAGAAGIGTDKIGEVNAANSDRSDSDTDTAGKHAANAPSATPVSLFVVNGASEPTPYDFVTDINGTGEVTAEFADEYDFSYPHDFDVTVVLTDSEGNTAEIVAFAHCVVSDTTAPIIDVGDDIYVTVGGSVSYKTDVVITDNTGEEISFSVDNSAVDLDTEGVYTVIYSAVDKAGNKAEEKRTVYVTEELPPSKDMVLALAKNIYENAILPSEFVVDKESKYDIAYGIYKWCYETITFDIAGTDREKGPLKLAYDGFTTLKGDCYTYMITAKYLFLVAGIDTVEVERLRYEGESNHYWLLVDIGDGYYHFDATARTTGKGTDTFMLTDAEVAEFAEHFEVPHYFRFDKSLYPERATESYFENAIPD